MKTHRQFNRERAAFSRDELERVDEMAQPLRLLASKADGSGFNSQSLHGEGRGREGGRENLQIVL